jgi:uncharacterized membrane protein HdeD (DUF308 family)
VDPDWIKLSWKLLVVRGVIGIVFGVLAMIWPLSTAIALALLWGFWALADGIGSLVQAFRSGTTGRLWLIVSGVIALLAAFFAIFSPALTAAALTWILGIWLIARGALELFGAFRAEAAAPRWVLVVGGLLSVVIGAIFVANPGGSAVALAFWLGLTALLWGITYVVIGLMVRGEGGAHAARPTAGPRPAV